MSEAIDMPLRTIARLIKIALPENMNCSKEVKSAIAKATGLFCLYLTYTAREYCNEGKRSLLTGDDILAALEECEFEPFIPFATEFLKEFRIRMTAQRQEARKKAAAAAATRKAVESQEAGEDEAQENQVDDDGNEEDDNDSKFDEVLSNETSKKKGRKLVDDEIDSDESSRKKKKSV